MPFKIVTSLKHTGTCDPDERVTIRLSEGHWRNIVCVNGYWNNTKTTRLMLVRDTWPKLIEQEATRLIHKANQRGRTYSAEDVYAWVGRPGQVMSLEDPAPSIHLIIGFSLDQRTIKLSGQIEEFRLH